MTDNALPATERPQLAPPMLETGAFGWMSRMANAPEAGRVSGPPTAARA